MSQTSKQTVIEAGTQIDGTITSECDVMVSGTMTGELLAPELNVTDSGSVHGEIRVTNLKSAGEVSGNIDAEAVELSGSVGNKTVINAGTLEVKLSQPQGGLQVTFGNCELRVGDTNPKSKRDNDEADSKQPKAEPVL